MMVDKLKLLTARAISISLSFLLVYRSEVLEGINSHADGANLSLSKSALLLAMVLSLLV